MIILVVSDQKNFRQKTISSFVDTMPGSEILIYDDTYGNLTDLEQYLFPSLFTQSPPIVHLKYMLNESIDYLTNELTKKMLASPTTFIFEEMSLPKSSITNFKKLGSLVHTSESVKEIKKTNDIFAVTKALTASDKKSRWLAYEDTLKSNSIEAVIGILYWKIKDLISKSKGGVKNNYKNIYKELLTAHVKAWQTGAPLETLIEKVILTN